MRRGFLLACLVACGGAPRPPAIPPAPPPRPAAAHPPVNHLLDPDLNPPPAPHLLAIDWKAVPLASDADALALWQRIAPTGDDWQEKLAELPHELPIARPLAIALLREGNFTCPAPPADACSPVLPDLPPPAPTATLGDPCLRRMLALWAIDQLEADDLPRVRDALRAIAAIPPPESQLVAAALYTLPVDDVAGRYELLAIAWRAGQHELVDGMLAPLDEAHLVTAATQLHIDGALDRLSADTHRATFLAAVTDEQLAPAARISAMAELAEPADKLPADLRAALLAAGRSPDCQVVAGAARTLEQHGDHALAPRWPRTRSTAAMMRELCVLASFEQMQRADEPSYFPGYIAPGGLELVTVSYDPYSDADPDGDGDVHTEHQVQHVPASEAVLPELDDLVTAMKHCHGTTCRGEDHDFRFTLRPGAGGLLLSRLEIRELPPCVPKPAISVP